MTTYSHRPQTLKSTHALKSGMTLLEIVIVIGIIALIMGAGIGFMGGIQGNAKETATKMKIKGLSTLLESYKLSGGRYPTEAQGLQALVAKPTTAPVPKRWKQQMKSLPIDPWENEYLYKNPGTKDASTFEILSKGEDGELGTDDDISSQED